LISNGNEDRPRKERAVDNFDKLEFTGEYTKEDFMKLLDSISST